MIWFGLASDRRCELWRSPSRLRIQAPGVKLFSIRFDGLRTYGGRRIGKIKT